MLLSREKRQLVGGARLLFALAACVLLAALQSCALVPLPPRNGDGLPPKRLGGISDGEKLELGRRIARKNWTGSLAALLAVAHEHAGRASAGGSAQELYNAAVEEIVRNLPDGAFLPGASTSVSTPRGSLRFSIDLQELQPDYFEEIRVASDIPVGMFRTQVEQGGLGVPLVAYRRGTLEEFISIAGLAVPYTALIEFDAPGHAVLRFYETLRRDRVRFGNSTADLAANFTAALAIQEIKTDKKLPELIAVLRAEPYLPYTGLYRTEPFDPNKIPVILVHGLNSRADTWNDIVNELRATRTIRENFQFFEFYYPTGLPILYSGARLRAELFRLREAMGSLNGRARDNMVLVGHSMGGLISKLQVQTGGDQMWDKLFVKPLHSLEVSEENREELRQNFYFEAQRDVRRIVYIAVPQRGSELAGGVVTKLASWVVKLPTRITAFASEIVTFDPAGLSQRGFEIFTNVSSSVQQLATGSEYFQLTDDLPITPGVRTHSIIGNRGKPGPLDDSSDGFVPYKSSHLPQADSELIVPDGHSCHKNPEAVAELQRILLLHLRSS